MNKVSALAIGSIGGLSLYYFIKSDKPASKEITEKPKKLEKQEFIKEKQVVDKIPEILENNSLPFVNWDDNWDCRQVSGEVKHPKAIRHLILVRHGQYNLKGKTDNEKVLTELGRKQAEMTGKRLMELELPISNVVMSTMTRAQETGNIILNQLKPKEALKIKHDSLIREGEPIQEVPVCIAEDYPSPHRFFQEGARIEAGFRAHFHRAPPTQEQESYTLLVGHANVIRYFVCRALQLPPEAWLRFNLHNASISWLSIFPDGRVALRLFGDCGHMPEDCVTRT